MFLKLYKKWKETRKSRLYREPEKVFEEQRKAIGSMSNLEWYRMFKDFIFSQYEEAIEQIKKSSPNENIEKQKWVMEFCEKMLSFLERRE